MKSPLWGFNRIARLRFRRAFQDALEHADITQHEMAIALDVDPHFIQDILKDGLTPLSPKFLVICRELGFDPLSFGFVGSFEARIKNSISAKGDKNADNDSQ